MKRLFSKKVLAIVCLVLTIVILGLIVKFAYDSLEGGNAATTVRKQFISGGELGNEIPKEIFGFSVKALFNLAFAAMVLISLSIIIVGLPYLVKAAADRDIFFTNVREGTAKAVLGSGGKFIKFLYQYDGYKFLTTQAEAEKCNLEREERCKKANGRKLIKKQIWDLVPMSSREKEIESKKGKKGLFSTSLGGVQFYGIPGLHKIHDYQFRWNSLRQNPGKASRQSGGGIYFEPHNEQLRYILLQSEVYYARLELAEDVRMLQLDVDFTVSLRVKNPYLALFRVQDWLEYTWGQILPAVRRTIRSHYDWINEVQFDKTGEKIVKTSSSESTNKRMARIIWDRLNDDKITSGQGESIDDDASQPKSTIDQLRQYYGIKIDDFTILRIDAAGEKKAEFIETATKVIKSLQEAKAKRIDFQVEVERLEAVYGKIKGFGGLGELIRRLEAYEKASEKGSVFVSAPELTGLAQAAAKKLAVNQ